MPRMDSLHGALPVMILKILVRRGPLHGYALTTQIEQMSDLVLRVEQGSLYPALYRMEEHGWIRPKWVTTENKKRARIYDITAAGKRHLETEEQRWHSVTAAVSYILKHA
jgi:PadR family transcriptional regulator, regulatory protein PadR